MSTDIQRFTPARIAQIEDVKEAVYIKNVAEAAAEFYKAQGDHLTSQEAKEISIRSTHRAGQILGDSIKSKGGRPKKTPQDTCGVSEYGQMLDDAGITQQTGSDWQRIGYIPLEELELYFAENPYEGREYSLGWLKRFAFMYIPESTGDEWYTPIEYIRSVRVVLGDIDLDPASCAMANGLIKAKKYFTKEDNGLEHDWYGSVFMNPPYSKNKAFAEKLLQQFEMGFTTRAIILVGAHGIETQWFRGYWNHILCFTGHRIRFNTPIGTKIAGNINGSVFVHLGRNEKQHLKFAKEFNQHGFVVRRWPDVS